MAGTAKKVTAQWSKATTTDALSAMAAAVNDLIDDLELLRSKYAAVLTKLDADAGVTDANYSSLHTVAAASLTAAKLQNRDAVDY